MGRHIEECIPNNGIRTSIHNKKVAITRTPKMNLNMKDIVLHSFSLTNGGALTKALLTEISENPLVWWEHKKKGEGRR